MQNVLSLMTTVCF